jgi:hypothetical protein
LQFERNYNIYDKKIANPFQVTLEKAKSDLAAYEKLAKFNGDGFYDQAEFCQLKNYNFKCKE